MTYGLSDLLLREIEATKKSIIDPKVIKSMDDYYSRTGYLTGLSKALEIINRKYSDEY